MEYLLKDHDAFTYITKIALKRRKALRNIAKSIEQEPEIKEQKVRRFTIVSKKRSEAFKS